MIYFMHNFPQYYDPQHVNFETFYEQYEQSSRKVLDKHCPIQTKKLKPRVAAWIDSEFKKNRALRRKLERKWKKS